MDVLKAAKALLSDNGIEAKIGRLDSFTGKEGVVLRKLPMSVTDVYSDRAKACAYLFQAVARKRLKQDAEELCEAIAETFDDAPVKSLDGSYQCVSTEIYTWPQELALDEAGMNAWEVSVRVDLILEGR